MRERWPAGSRSERAVRLVDRRARARFECRYPTSGTLSLLRRAGPRFSRRRPVAPVGSVRRARRVSRGAPRTRRVRERLSKDLRHRRRGERVFGSPCRIPATARTPGFGHRCTRRGCRGTWRDGPHIRPRRSRGTGVACASCPHRAHLNKSDCPLLGPPLSAAAAGIANLLPTG